ncbi:NB-ARC domain disease resistance protein [Medicago truncatula]|uniref:NB-ARC domain disease resistance protein n=2 Tax=Medicago truncatula TaxID=3880 RepID=G7LEB0_MEDTR|nr:NB-ARC domain disease resistance protein [Medicago truncatula]
MTAHIAYGVATRLINRLASAAFDEFGRINGVMDELERLKNTVESIKAVLLDAEDKQELKDVLLPAVDLIDEFLIEDMIHKRDKADKNKVTQVFHSFSLSRAAFCHKMALEIEKIQKRRETSSLVLESDIIGREDDKKEIIHLLRQPHGNQNVSLIAIVGIGGLGKTTLAQLVYNDGEVQNLFEISMWVCVSENFDVKTIVKNMVESLTNSKIDDKLSLENLQNMLCKNLNGKRFFLILDDIWNESFEKWAQLRTYLMCDAQGTKVLVTTRSKAVAQTMGVRDLLKKIAFGDDTIGVNQTLESIGILQNKSEEREWIDVLQGEFWKLCEDNGTILPVLKLSYQNLSFQQRQCFAYCALYPKDWVIEKDELIQMWMAQGYLECSIEKHCMEDVGNQFVNIFLMKSFFQDAKLNLDGDIQDFKMHDLMHDLATQVAGTDCCYLDNKSKRFIGRPVHVSVEFDAFLLLESLDASRLRTLIMFSSYDDIKLDREELTIISNFKFLRVLKLRDSFLSKLSGSIEKLKHLRYLNLLSCHELGCLPKSIGNLICLQTIKVSLAEEVILSTKIVSKLINLRHLEVYNWTHRDKKRGGFAKMGLQRYKGKGVIFSERLSSLTNIIEIHLGYCQGFRYLPPLERLPFLRSLQLHCINNLEYIYYEEPILLESFFPSLESLKLWECHELRGWQRMGDDFDDINSSHHLLLPQFHCLSKLAIRGCQMLTHMPTFPNIKKRLSLTECCVEILEATLNIAMSQYSIGFPPLSMLKSIEIGEFSSDVKKLPKNWLQNLTSLENLEFFFLSSQQFEVIETWFKDDFIYLPSLKRINFYNCFHLKALPDWICNLSSLHHIEMINCRDLALLPQGMPRLTNLCTLEFIKCPLLVEECQTETSAIWSKIAHIPNIIMK